MTLAGCMLRLWHSLPWLGLHWWRTMIISKDQDQRFTNMQSSSYHLAAAHRKSRQCGWVRCRWRTSSRHRHETDQMLFSGQIICLWHSVGTSEYILPAVGLPTSLSKLLNQHFRCSEMLIADVPWMSWMDFFFWKLNVLNGMALICCSHAYKSSALQSSDAFVEPKECHFVIGMFNLISFCPLHPILWN